MTPAPHDASIAPTDPCQKLAPPATTTRPPCCLDRVAVMTAERLCVSYHGVAAVRDVTMPIYRGCITALIGPSGCGKSSFLAALNRMTDLIPGCTVTGRIALDGRDVHDSGLPLVELRRNVGMVFQKPNPFPLSVRDNLAYPLRHHGMRERDRRECEIEGILRRVGLWDEVKGRLDRPALALSGGQQQRLCLARALVLDPSVILMDEPCSALDPFSSGVVEELILSLRCDLTVVIVTHNLAQARRVADDVAFFWIRNGAGQLIERGPAEDVFMAPRHELTSAYVRGVRG